MAGRIPEIRPIIAAKLVPKRIFAKLKTNSKSNTLVKIIAIIHTKNNPINPPITQRIIASKRNWNRINLFLAPKDF
jgi:hypothetical protein